MPKNLADLFKVFLYKYVDVTTVGSLVRMEIKKLKSCTL